MNNGTQNYDKFRRAAAFVFGVAVLLTSLFFSKEGFAFKVDNEDIWWVGWVIAGAVSAAQFMFNTQRKELDWTIVLVGLTAYVYSIWSNIQGWESLRGVTDYMNWAGGIFMDVFPEKAIAWSLGAIKVGDFVGNFWSVLKNPERLDETNTQSAYKPPVQSNGAKRVGNRQEHIQSLQRQHGQFNSQKRPDQRQPIRPASQVPNNPEQDIPQFMKDAMWDASRAKGG